MECISRPETPKILVFTSAEFVGKNCFFVEFAMKTVSFCGFIPEFMEIRALFEMRTFFFWSLPPIS